MSVLRQRFTKLEDTLHVQIKQIYSVRKRGKDACKRQNIEHRKRDYIKQFMNLTFMQGTWNINPNQDQFTSNVRPSTCLVRKENKAYLNFLSMLVMQVIEEKM